MGDHVQPSDGSMPMAALDACVWPPKSMFAKHPSTPHISSLDEYQRMHRESIEDPDGFWRRQARALLSWSKDFSRVRYGNLIQGDIAWFLGGELNASHNCIDRHAFRDPNKVVIIHEANHSGSSRTITYGQLLRDVCQLSWVLTMDFRVRKGDLVAIYMPTIPEAVVAMLACARIGAIHTVIFAGFSADSLRDRIVDAGCRVVITVDESQWADKSMGLKAIVDEALSLGVPDGPVAPRVLVYRNTGVKIPWVPGRDMWWHKETQKWPGFYPSERMDSEDPLFLLYTSGSTGKPKGVLQTTGGYLVGAAATGKYVFDIHDEDRFFCGGDVAWITGHTYVVYAPLLLGATTVTFAGIPVFPTPSRYWDMIESHRITHLYVAPTALRLLKRLHPEIENEMPYLRVLGSVGEPIAADTWNWYFESVGKSQSPVVDTYWQTETGSHVLTPLAAVTPTKAGSSTLPFFGIEPALLDPATGRELDGSGVEGALVFKQPWPSMARTVWGAHQRYMEAYLTTYKGYYFTGDGAARDQDGFYWIKGRMDDVLNISGHRISTAEIEAALVEHRAVAESAVVGSEDELTGQAINVFVALSQQETIQNSCAEQELIKKELVGQIRSKIGPFAAPKNIFILLDLPKTRSGKIMRRILRKILAGEEDQLGDITTLADPSVVVMVIDVVRKSKRE